MLGGKFSGSRSRGAAAGGNGTSAHRHDRAGPWSWLGEGWRPICRPLLDIMSVIGAQIRRVETDERTRRILSFARLVGGLPTNLADSDNYLADASLTRWLPRQGRSSRSNVGPVHPSSSGIEVLPRRQPRLAVAPRTKLSEPNGILEHMFAPLHVHRSWTAMASRRAPYSRPASSPW